MQGKHITEAAEGDTDECLEVKVYPIAISIIENIKHAALGEEARPTET